MLFENMSNNPRAVYIPPAKRKQQAQHNTRFHGAFTGGFSAGYFNTVDTNEGWKPSNEQRRQQKLEDFMDEQDHEEWGGPKSVRQEFKEKDKDSSLATTTSTAAPLESLLRVSRPLTVGPRLLRRLGWREGAGAAFVPAAAGEEPAIASKEEEDTLSKIHLSKKKLRQIQLQSSRIQLPPPKVDPCGLGFEAHDNAPEFRRHREQRQELGRLRARGQSNVYRVSNILGDGGGDDDDGVGNGPPRKNGGGNVGDDYITYETAEDFVGSRTVGGFALRDDEDDAYDPLALWSDRNTRKPSAKEKLLSDEYNTEVVDIEEDSDVDEGGSTHFPKSSSKMPPAAKEMNAVLGGALASWAIGGKKEAAKDSGASSAPSAAFTSSGRPPVAGFRLGASLESHKKRFPGPDLPRDYKLKRHVFGPNERPAIFQTIGRALQLEREEQGRQQRQLGQQLAPTPKEPMRSNQPSLAGNQFSTLAVAMKNRFTSGTTSGPSGSDVAGEQPLRPGLYQPPSVQVHQNPETPSSSASSVKRPIVVRRTSHAFAPLPLLCKRFGVSAPRHVMVSATTQSTRTTEASYFEHEVLSTVREVAAKAPNKSLADDSVKVPRAEEEAQRVKTMAEEAPEVPRPAIGKLKAIFEPDSGDSSSGDTDLDSMRDDLSVDKDSAAFEKQAGTPKDSFDPALPDPLQSTGDSKGHSSELVEYRSRHLAVGSDLDASSDEDSRSEPSLSRRKERKRKKSHKKRKRSSKQHKRSKSSSRYKDGSEDDASLLDAGSTERKRESKERRRKHSKKRSKKHSSAR